MENRKFKLYTEKVVEFKHILTGRQTDSMYRLMGAGLQNPARVAVCNAVAHIVSIDGTAVLPLSNEVAFQGIIDRFDEIELSQLMECYERVASGADAVADIEELKNE